MLSVYDLNRSILFAWFDTRFAVIAAMKIIKSDVCTTIVTNYRDSIRRVIFFFSSTVFNGWIMRKAELWFFGNFQM